LPLCSPATAKMLALDRTVAFALRGRWLTARAMADLLFIFDFSKENTNGTWYFWILLNKSKTIQYFAIKYKKVGPSECCIIIHFSKCRNIKKNNEFEFCISDVSGFRNEYNPFRYILFIFLHETEYSYILHLEVNFGAYSKIPKRTRKIRKAEILISVFGS